MLALLAVAVAAGGASAAAPPVPAGAYLLSRQQPDGGFAEPGRSSTPGLTAWAVLGLRAAGADPAAAAGTAAAEYLRGHAAASATDLELQLLALKALGEDVTALADRLEQLRLPSGRIGPAVNSTIWGVLALRAAGRPAGARTISFLLRCQRRGGGWSWSTGAGVESNDTAAAIEALRAAGLGARHRAIRKGIAYLRSVRNRDGGFAWSPGADSDAQSTAWALQAFAAAGTDPGKSPFRYLARLRQPDGSYRYSARYTTTPVWITAQVLAALSGRPFPLP